MSTADSVFRRVHQATSRLVRELFVPFEEGLRRMGLGPDGNPTQLRQGIERSLERLLFTPLSQPPYAGMRIDGGQDKRTAAIQEFFVGLGVPEQTASSYAATLVATRRFYNDDGTRRPYDQVVREAHPTEAVLWQQALRHWLPLIGANGRRTYALLRQINDDAAAPYRGSPSSPDSGIAQTVELLQRFPGLADRVYEAARLPGIQGFPPVARGPTSGDTAIFVEGVEQQLAGQRRDELLFAAGLAVVAIAVTAVSFGTLGPLAAMAIGTGLGTVQGGYLIYDRAQALAEARVAATQGAVDAATLQRLENSLQGAWGMLAVDMVTGGALGRFGGATALSALWRGTVISGAGGAVSTAVDPNVWSSPDRVGLILEGAVIGAVVGGGGGAAGAGISRLFTRGARAQIAITRESGPLTENAQVRIAPSRDVEPVSATVTSVDRSSGTVSMRLEDGGTVTVRADRAIEVSTGSGAPSAVRGAPVATVAGRPIPPDSHQGGYYGTSVHGRDARDVIDEAFQRGLPRRGDNMDLQRHTEEMDRNAADFAQRSAFRGTTHQVSTPDGSAGAAVWADAGGVVFEIRGVPTWDVNRALDGRVQRPDGTFRGNLMGGEQEYAILSEVPANRIVRAGIVTESRNGIPIVRPSDWIQNPRYVPR